MFCGKMSLVPSLSARFWLPESWFCRKGSEPFFSSEDFDETVTDCADNELHRARSQVSVGVTAENTVLVNIIA